MPGEDRTQQHGKAVIFAGKAFRLPVACCLLMAVTFAGCTTTAPQQSSSRFLAWNDSQPTDDFDTPLITPRNIAVLDRWMHLPKMRDAQGRVRGVLLSEQGFNTPDYSPESELLQAAGLVFMWRQMRGLASIEAFHNHRWVDHPDEDGLLLGLRRLPAAGGNYGEKKIAWDVYRALDTGDEQRATRCVESLLEGPGGRGP